MKLIDKDKQIILAEIDRRMEDAAQYSTGAYNGMKEIRDYISSLPEEPVSEELWEAAQIYYEELQKEKFEGSDVIDAFKAGAKWQKEQFEKNRLKHCDSITNEQAELEQGFIDQHLDKYQRMPTFLDAVEYGMRLQKEQMMAKAIDAKLLEGHLIRQEGVTHPLHAGDKVKVIVIKED